MYYLPSFYHNICFIKLKNKHIKLYKTHLTMAGGPELSSNLRLTLHLIRFICINSELFHLTHTFEVWNFTWYRLWNFTITILLGKTKYLWCLNFEFRIHFFFQFDVNIWKGIFVNKYQISFTHLTHSSRESCSWSNKTEIKHWSL